MLRIIQLSVHGFDNNYSYLVCDGKKAMLIDPTGDLEVIQKAIKENSLQLVLVLATHSHPDHTELIKYFSAKGVKVFLPKAASLGKVEEIDFGKIVINAIHTPGHTSDSVCYLIENNLFSGDTLFVKGVGTTAYGGNDEELRESIEFLFSLDKKIILWPGHNYGGEFAELGTALKNSHLKPNARIHEKIRQMVLEYESKQGNKKF